MPRGRQYYDPIQQVPGRVEENEDYSRIELYPETMDPREETAQPGKWRARRIDSSGMVAEVSKGDFSRERAQAEAEALWPGLMVHELRSEFEDSTWNGIGPSPRGWQGSPPESDLGAAVSALPNSAEVGDPGAGGDVTPAVDGVVTVDLRGMKVEAGTYFHKDDIQALLRHYAAIYDENDNPSASQALRTAAEMLG